MQGLRDQHATAIAINDVVEQIKALQLAGKAETLTAIDGHIDKTIRHVVVVRERFLNSLEALFTYGFTLQAIHTTADGAAARIDQASKDAEKADRDKSAWAHAAQNLRNGGIDLERAERYDWYASQAGARADLAREALGQASRDLDAAAQNLDEAASTAIALLKDVFDDTSDGLKDFLGSAVDWVADRWSDFTSWASSVIDDAIRDVRNLFADIVQVLADALLVVIAVVVIVAALAAVAVALANPVSLVPLALGLLNPDKTNVIDAILTVFTASLIGQAYIEDTILSDALRPDPEVAPYAMGDDDAATAAYYHLNSGPPATTADLIQRASWVDQAGGDGLGDGSAVIDITSIVGADGVERFIVTLPSTQDWSFFGDSGAPNDWQGNVALMMADPSVRTQYERAFDAALAQAGVTSTDPLLLEGFSQGGILAGFLAAYRSDSYNIQGVLTAGSAIDDFPIPETVNVVQVADMYDLVPQLDGVWDSGDHTYVNHAPDGSPDAVTSHLTVMTHAGTLLPQKVHDSNLYRQTVVDADGYQQANELFADFLVDPRQNERLAGPDRGVIRSASIQYQFREEPYSELGQMLGLS